MISCFRGVCFHYIVNLGLRTPLNSKICILSAQRKISTSAIMHQTKIGQFFKRAGSSSEPASNGRSADDLALKVKRKTVTSPAKKVANESDDEDLVSKVKRKAATSPATKTANESDSDADDLAPKVKHKVSTSAAKKAVNGSRSSAADDHEPKVKRKASRSTSKAANGSSADEDDLKPKVKRKASKTKTAIVSSDDDDDLPSKAKRKASSSSAKKVANESDTDTDDHAPKVKRKVSTSLAKKATNGSSDDEDLPLNVKRKASTVKTAIVSSDEEDDLRSKATRKASSSPAKKASNGSTADDLAPMFKRKASTSPADKTAKVRKTSKAANTGTTPAKSAKVKKASPAPDSDDESPVKAKCPSTPPVTPKTPMSLGKSTGATGWDNDYNPAQSKYHPIDDASWERGQRVPYLALSKTLEAIEATSSRLKNIEILANYFRSVIALTPEDLIHSIYLCLNKLAPAYEGVELGIAETNIMKAIAQATGRSLSSIKADAAAQGDLGLVAETSRSNQRTLMTPQPLTVLGVFHKLKEIASLTGNASFQKKNSMITSMLVSCKHSEARYLTRSLAGKLRIGLAEQSLLQALAQATFLTPPNQDRDVWPLKVLNSGKRMSGESLKAKIDDEAFKLKSCFCECPNYELLVNAIFDDGVDNLSKSCKLTPGIPPRPMLAQPTKGIPDVLHRFEGIKFACEYKYDGERAQIHLLEDGSVRIFSRNQENNTSKYPDIISRFPACIQGDVTSCILDTEAVAWDIEKESILPFQVLSTRKRKDANEAEIKVQVQLFAFDLIFLNGESLVKKPLIERRRLLQDNFQPIKGQFSFATSLDTDNVEQLQEFLEESIKGNCEGLMVKTLEVNAGYELAKRSHKWLKLKKDYLESGGDSLDLVVIGGFNGKGKRTGTYGGFLLACYNPQEEEYQTICKLGTGFSDEDLQQHTDSLKPHIIPKPKSYYNFNSQLTPDVWFEAIQVWEIKCADLSLSPVHTAAVGIADPERGISLRFPRFLRIREDKNIEDATSARQVADMYRNQDVVKNSSKDKKFDDDEFY